MCGWWLFVLMWRDDSVQCWWEPNPAAKWFAICCVSVWEQLSWLGKQFINQVKRGRLFIFLAVWVCVCVCVSLGGWVLHFLGTFLPFYRPSQALGGVQGLSPNSLFFFVSTLSPLTHPSPPQSSETLFSLTLLGHIPPPLLCLFVPPLLLPASPLPPV